MSHIPPLDPQVAARKGFRESEERIKRFWREVTVEPDGQGWAVRLDGRTPRTPGGHSLVLPTADSARMAAAEWVAQGEFLDPGAMPATRLANTAVDAVRDAREAVADEIAAFAGSDCLCYLADAPSSLVERQAAEWTPWRDWAARELDVGLISTTGLIHQPQSPEAIARVRDLALELDDYALTGLAMATPLLGSAVLALALYRGALTGEAAFALSRIDEDHQEGRWGVDDENARRTEARRAEAVLLERWFQALSA